MISTIIFLAVPVVAVIFYVYFNLSSVASKSSEFNRITEVLTLEKMIQQVCQCGLGEKTCDEELEALRRNLVATFRGDVIRQHIKEARKNSRKIVSYLYLSFLLAALPNNLNIPSNNCMEKPGVASRTSSCSFSPGEPSSRGSTRQTTS